MSDTPRFPAAPVLFAGLALLASTALPASERGAYATAMLGLANQRDQTFEFTTPASSQRRQSALDSGLFSGGALGWDFGNGWRVEGEFAYQSVDSEVPGFLPPAPQGSGNFASTSLAVNAIYSVDLFGTPRARTYVGLGAVRLTEVDVDFETAAGERSFSGSGSGFQALFGARYQLGERWFLDAGVRWLRASSLDLDGEGSSAGRITTDYAPWAVTVGVGWRF
jgi:opacity protein-like surface antigen